MTFPTSIRAAMVSLLLCAALVAAEPTVLITRANATPDPAIHMLRIAVPPAVATSPPAPAPINALPEIQNTLNAWYQQGTAAGNIGDCYDNRDRGHSQLGGYFPQMTRITYDAELKQHNLDYGVQVQLIFDRVVMGNSSTALGGEAWRSNPRLCYVNPLYMGALEEQYRHNHIYLYPEHRDYDPGHNGDTGYGDVFDANTPYVIISQGSSGSDQPFMKAVLATLAAFQPETKKKLIEKNLIAPTVQMILRRTYGKARGDNDYLSGAAHPPVFDGSKLNLPAMIGLAHSIAPDKLPPVARVAVVSETSGELGVDYFEAAPGTVVFNTANAVARLHRPIERDYKMTVSAGASTDPNGLPLTYHWVVLQGDPNRIAIKKLKDDGSLVELTVAYHARFPIAPDSDMMSNRVDVGLFVNNGAYYSAPAFVSLASLDSERRTYDQKGRIVEVDYGARDVGWKIMDWAGLLERLAADAPPVGFEPGDAAAHDALARAAQRSRAAMTTVEPAKNAWDEAKKTFDGAAEAVKKARSDKADPDFIKAALETQQLAEQRLQTAKRVYDNALAAVDAVIDEKSLALQGSARQWVERAIDRCVNDPSFVVTHWAAIAKAATPQLRARFEGNAKKLAALDAINGTSRRLAIDLNVDVLEHMQMQGVVQFAIRTNYFDPMLATQRQWCDLYHYDGDADKPIGWTRQWPDGHTDDFTADGLRVLDRDAQGRPLHARTVRYAIDPNSKGVVRSLMQTDGDMKATYHYEDEHDHRGRIVEREPIQ
ncbi:MAG: hypothetical protein GC162_01520 [Planctomycetes bacterium]|nr:hypothetical protein [Planctomycetota bacterium]